MYQYTCFFHSTNTYTCFFHSEYITILYVYRLYFTHLTVSYELAQQKQQAFNTKLLQTSSKPKRVYAKKEKNATFKNFVADSAITNTTGLRIPVPQVSGMVPGLQVPGFTTSTSNQAIVLSIPESTSGQWFPSPPQTPTFIASFASLQTPSLST